MPREYLSFVGYVRRSALSLNTNARGHGKVPRRYLESVR